MTYYMVRKEHDQTPIHWKNQHTQRITYYSDILVGGELYTKRELDILRWHSVDPLPDDYFQKVKVPMQYTVVFMGARLVQMGHYNDIQEVE